MIKTPSSARQVLRRIDKRLDALAVDGKRPSDRSMSIVATGSPDTIRGLRRNLENGTQQGVSSETISKLARALKTSPEWLLTGHGLEAAGDEHIDSSHILEEDKHRAPKVRIVGYVGAGSTAHYYALSDQDYEEVEPPAGANERTVAVEIKGTSFGPLLDTWLVFYDNVRSPITPDLYGEICVVGLADDRILIKKIRRNANGTITLLSNAQEDPIEDAKIEWAAKVTDMRPRR